VISKLPISSQRSQLKPFETSTKPQIAKVMEKPAKKTNQLIEKATPPDTHEESNLLTFSPSQTISFEIEEKQSIEE
jgi:hypothetical protein